MKILKKEIGNANGVKIYSITFTLLIAFVIAISLFLISRVRGKKTV